MATSPIFRSGSSCRSSLRILELGSSERSPYPEHAQHVRIAAIERLRTVLGLKNPAIDAVHFDGFLVAGREYGIGHLRHPVDNGQSTRA